MSADQSCPQCGRVCAGLRGLSIHSRLMHSDRDYSSERRVYSSRPRQKRTQEQRRRISEASKRHWDNEGFRQRMKDIAVARWTPALRRLMHEKMSAIMGTAEQREAARRRMLDEPRRDYMSKLISQKVASGEMRSGRSRWHDYRCVGGEVVRVQGTYELRMAAALDQWGSSLGYSWSKNRHHFPYQSIDGRVHRYTPDFEICTGSGCFYAEIKGFLNLDGVIKLYDLSTQIPVKLYVLFENAIRELEGGKDPFTESRNLLNVSHEEILKGRTW